MLLGPRDFPDLRSEIISDISDGNEGALKNELLILSPMRCKGKLLGLDSFLVISLETVTKNLLKMSAMTAGSDVILPFESLSLFIKLMLPDFLTFKTDLIPDHRCFMLLLFLMAGGTSGHGAPKKNLSEILAILHSCRKN